jgi:uncharacterized protein (DUF697 family)
LRAYLVEWENQYLEKPMKRDTKATPNSESTAVNDPTTETAVEETPAATAGQSDVPDNVARAEAVRTRAAQLLSERRFAEARKALEEADEIEAVPASAQPETFSRRVMAAVRYPLTHLPLRRKAAPADAAAATAAPAVEPDERAVDIVNLHSKLAVVAGLVPGGLLNFAAILAVQVTMVWRIADTFGQRQGKNRIRGLILSLFGSVVPTAVGGGVMYNIVRIPAIVAGTVAGFVVTPILAYAMTQAIGNTFIMHFESGGTLLTFDARKFRDYFIKEFQEAGGTLAAS